MGEDREVDEQEINAALESFAPRLVELGLPIWKIQSDRLREFLNKSSR